MFWDTSAWHPEDKTWKAERKKEWRFISNNLKQVGYGLIGKSSGFLTTHRWLFFEGDVMDEDLPTGSWDFGCKLPLFLMWYHPELTDAFCEQVIEHFSQDVYTARALSDSRKSFFQFARDKKYKKEYGFMGGKEALIFEHIMGERASQIIESHGKILFESPDFLGQHCYNGLNCVLRSLNSPWHPGQYLWDSHVKPIFNEVEEPRLSRYKDIFKMALFFDEHPNTGKGDPRAIAMKDKLLAEYAAGELPHAMNKLWEEAKSEGI